jgi:hypothetical protein
MATTRRVRAETKTDAAAAAGYDAMKTFEGKRYTGMKVGRTHKWYYDRGEWRERKVTPDEWTIEYAVTKRRAGRAPEGSGVPVGTEYHWFVLADQFVQKLDANSYSTSMRGLKVKLAHRRAGSEKWSASEAAQRRRLIATLRQMAVQLEGEELAHSASPVEPAREGRKNSRVRQSKSSSGNSRRARLP